MSLNPGVSNHGWNHTKPDKPDYSLEMYGTVVAIQEVQAREYNPGGNMPGRPKFWPEGNPVFNIRMAFAAPDGSLKSIQFAEAGKEQRAGRKPSLHMQMFALTNGNMRELVGKTLHLWTWPVNPQTGQEWGRGNPRLYGVEEITDGTKYELACALPEEFKVDVLLANDGASGGQPTPPPMYGQFYAPPTAQPQQPYPYPQQQPTQFAPQQAAPMPQPMQPMQPQYGQQPMQPVPPAPQQMQAPVPMPAVQAMPPQQAPAMSAPMPQGMDQAVAQAMQSVGAVNVQPVSIYDDEIPFD